MVATPVRIKYASENLTAGCYFRKLRDGDLLASITSIVSSPSGLTFANQQINSGVTLILGFNVQPGQAVLVQVGGGTGAAPPVRTYLMRVTCLTVAGDEITEDFPLQVLQ